jgi:hypothetical protein
MTDFILYHENSLDTGRALQRALGIEGGEHMPEQRYEHLIRWGNREQIRYRAARTLNTSSAMDKASNKTRALEVMAEHNVSHAPSKTRFDGVLLLARKASHMHGSGCYFITSQYDFDNARRIGCTSFTEFVPTKREFRVHVISGEPVFLFERVCPSDPQSLNIRNEWNEERRSINEVPSVIIAESLKVMAAMGLDFGAVDIGFSMNDRPYVYEVNTAPGLVNDDTHMKPSFAVYKNAFATWLRT